MQTAVLNNEIISSKILVRLVGITSFVIFMAFGAYVYIPLRFTPVPITLQTFFVLLSGAILGRKDGALSQIIYLALGITGIPMFLSGSFGIAYIFGPTGGYLLGFITAAYVIGRILSMRDDTIGIITALVAGEFAILFLGACWLRFVLHFSVRDAFFLGVVPFVPGDMIKLAVAAYISKTYIRRAKVLFY